MNSRPRAAASPGRPAKGATKRKNVLKCHVTDRHKAEVDKYCASREGLTTASLLYQLLIQIVPDPDA